LGGIGERFACVLVYERRRLSGDTARQATSPEVKDLRSVSLALKECVADLTLENRQEVK
jgi:hypothetical protein